MKLKIALLSSLVVLAFIAAGCGLVGTVTGKNAGTVADLWSDVPPFTGATKSNIDIPLPVNLMIQGFMQAANSDTSSDTKLNKFDFIAYDTSSAPADVSNFYTADKMKQAGWDQQDTGGCTGSTGSSGTQVGFCAFGKKGTGGAMTVLLIVPVQDDQTKKTQIFYVRFEGTSKTPTAQ